MMKQIVTLKNLAAALILNIAIGSLLVHAQDNKLWYKQPASIWTEALPVGNGRLGAMVFGGVDQELLQLNEATFWSGGPVKQNVNPDAAQYLPQVRQALFNGDYKKANELTKKMQGVYSESYLPLAHLHITQAFVKSVPTAYYRDLNIGNATATTKFTVNGITYKREVFSSVPDQVIIIRFSSSKPKQLNLKINLKSQINSVKTVFQHNALALKGKAPAHVDPSYVSYNKEPIVYNDDPCRGMRFEVLARATSKDGTVSTDTSGIKINKASEVTLIISAATSFNGYNQCPDKNEEELAARYLNQAVNKPFSVLYAAHLADFKKYFNRVTLNLGDKNSSTESLPTDERLDRYTKGGTDLGLEALYFKYGRYLLISSSRVAGVPANLQGIWNKELRAPWSSNYTSNINVQMNYWMAEDCNLSEMHQPLFDLIKELSITGKAVAKDFYHANG